MAPIKVDSLTVLQARCDQAEKKFSYAELYVKAMVLMFGITAAANLATFAWISPDHLLIASSLLCAIAALSTWSIGMRYVDRLELEYQRREQAIDEYLNLPVS